MATPSKNYTLAFKVAALVIPAAMAILGAMYGDLTPFVRDICEAALPANVQVHEVDAGVAR